MKGLARFSPRRAGASRIEQMFMLEHLFIPSSRGMPEWRCRGQKALILVGSDRPCRPLFTGGGAGVRQAEYGIQMRYLPEGTDVGIKQISHGAGDFSAGEAQLTEEDRTAAGLIELPVVVIAIVPIYNLPDVQQDLRLSGEVLAAIFLGEVRSWNAPQIAKLNPEITLPNLAIRVINRSGGKGSNYVFTDFLSKAKF